MDYSELPFFCDGHADTLSRLTLHGGDFTRNRGPNHVNLPRLLQARQNLQIMAVFIPAEVAGRKGFEEALQIAATGHRLGLELVRTGRDLERCRRASQPFLMLSLEGAGPLGGSLHRLDILFHFGFRAVGLTHNHNNQAAGGCMPASGPTRGLSLFGRRLVQQMERLGMAVDTAHLSRRAFWQLAELATRPLINSHTCCARFVDIERNMTDEQLREIARSGGLAAVTYVPRFLTTRGRTSSRDVFRHLEHMVEVMGIDHVGLGSDFDGVDRLPVDLASPAQVPRLVEHMRAAGWKHADIARVLGGNWYRVLKQLLPA